jgi:catechol 2,3-dioxygenase-like lactoylglutathione lyase family enzyme
LKTSAYHHPGLRVTDIDRAARFYLDAFDGHWLTMPFVLEGEFPEVVMGGPPGVRFKVCHIGFDQGAVELFQFLEPVHPIEVVHPSRGNLIHFGLLVEDVREALERVEAAGGRRLWPDVYPWGTANVIYVADPDENIVELTDVTLVRIVELTIEAIPEADPNGGQHRRA